MKQNQSAPKRQTQPWNNGPSFHQKRMRLWTIVLTLAGIVIFGACFYLLNNWSLAAHR